MKDYFTTLIKTLIIMAIIFLIISGLYYVFGVWGVIGGFIAFMLLVFTAMITLKKRNNALKP